MDSTNDIITTSSPTKPIDDDNRIDTNIYLNDIKEDSISELVRNRELQQPEKTGVHNSMENGIYNLMCPWDYLVNFSNISNYPESSLKSASACNKQLKSLISNFELLISQFKVLLEGSCAFETYSGKLEAEIESSRSNDIIGLSDNLSVVLGHSKEADLHLVVQDISKISDEYQRTSKVLDSVIEFVGYRDVNETFCGNNEEDLHIVNNKYELIDSESAGAQIDKYRFIKEEKDTVAKQEPKERKSQKRISKLAQDNEIRAQKKMRPQEPLGYKLEFCVSEEVYNEVLSKGSPYTCSLCQKVFKDRRNFENHLNGRCIGVPYKGMDWEPKWKKEGGRLHCLYEGCTETYTHKQSLYKHHQRTHIKDTANLPFKCDQCDKSFIIKSILSIHIQEMHKEKVRKCCEICGASVRSNTDLKLHMRRRHTGEMPFKCEYCDFRGVNISSVKRHTRLKHETHLLTFHCCDICGKQFKTKANLKEHIPTHSDKRTFLCKICGKCLKNDCSYRRHMVCVHGIKFTCEICNKDYSALIGLKVHQRNVHGINS